MSETSSDINNSDILIEETNKTKPELLKEISDLRQRLRKLEGTYAAELKEIENTFNRERILFRTLIDCLPDAVYAKDKDYKRIITNPADLKNVGCQDESDVLNKTVFDFFPDGMAREIQDEDKEVIKSGKPMLNKEWSIFDSNGNKHWLLTSKIPYRDNEGKIIGLLGIDRDITERKLAEETFQKERILLRTLIDNIPDAIFAKDREGRKIIANLADLNNMGRNSEREVIGKTDSDLFPDEIAKGFIANDHSVIETGNPILKREEFFINKEGKKHWLLTSKLPLRDDDGNIIGLMGIGRDITEQKLAQENLREQVEKFKLVFENAFDGINIFEENADPTKRRLVDCNTRYAEMSGRTREELLKIGYLEGLSITLSEDNSQAIRETKVFRGQYSWIRPDGKPNVIEYTAAPIKIQGKTYTIGIDRDITEQKRMDEVLQKEKILLRTIIDNLPDAIYVKDNACRKTIANHRDVQNLGCQSEKEIIGKTDFEFFSKEIADGFYKDDQSILKTGKSILNREEFFMTKDGEKRWLLTSKLPLQDNSGKILGLIGIGRDITDRKHMEETLRAERNLLEQLINTVPDLVFFKDSAGRYILNNTAHLKFAGVKRQEDTIGKTVFDFFAREKAVMLFSEEMKILETGEPIIEKEEILHHKEKGEQRCYLTTKIPLRDERGNVKGILGISHDITKRKRYEEAIKEANSELEKANIELKKANEVKGQFLANMSHEIRTPLNAVIGMTGLLLDTKLNDEQNDYAKTILNSGDILLSLINDILDFSKIEAQKIELEKQPFDVRTCVEEALDVVASKAADKKLELTYSMGEGLSKKVIGDVTRLRQILVNLLSNAIKFTEKGEVVVSVSGQLQDHYGYQLRFSVKDTGIGIPLESQKRLFQSFSQVDASTTRKFGGTGLGLAISKQLSELMGGSMWVESSGVPGEGASFHFTIMVQLSAEKEEHDDLSALYGKRILIVDDNGTNREILTQQMESLQMTPTSTASGPEALELLAKDNTFDVAILDYHMPEMDGIMLAEEIKKLHNGATPPLILLSSYGYKDKKNNLALFKATLTKPIKLSHLQNALITVLKKNGSIVKKYDPVPTQFDGEIAHKYPLRILLAEDNKVNQKVALKILEKIGYKADVAFNGFEVLEALKLKSYDVILMDIQMPEMDGTQATIEIRNKPDEFRQLQIVAMTANALKTDHDKYISIGMDDYIVKPFKIEDLVNVLVKCFNSLSKSA